jgi:serine/threonine protein kinase
MALELVRDRYQIIKKLGRGGWGITYLARDTQLPDNPYRVIKEITPSPSLSLDKNKERFEYEAKALYTLGTHSQIPQLFARFEQNKHFYLVQEYIKGKNLQVKFREGLRIPPQQIIDFLLDILEVLKFVHRHGIIHRDLKPANIIQREEDCKFVLIDFGAVKEIATLEYTPTGEFKTTIAIGTPGYMPAEQSNCNPQYNSDIYALGIIAIRAITGLLPPVSSYNNSEVTNYMQIDSQTGEVLWKNVLSQADSINIDSRLEAILYKMVRYNFCDRYPSVEEVIADLRQLQPVPSVTPSVSPSSSFPTFKLLCMGLFGLITGALLMKVLPPLLLDPKAKDYHINFTEVCNSDIVKGEKLKNYIGTPEHITLKHPPFIWTVFRWKCVFTYRGDTQIRGINLNNYCAATYGESEYKYEAYFKNYLDANSWYCTNVGTKLESN